MDNLPGLSFFVFLCTSLSDMRYYFVAKTRCQHGVVESAVVTLRVQSGIGTSPLNMQNWAVFIAVQEERNLCHLFFSSSCFLLMSFFLFPWNTPAVA